jgi:hypothetical protein
VSFGDQDVVVAVFARVAGVGALGVECVCGDDDVGELAVAGCGVWGVLAGAAGAVVGVVGVGVGSGGGLVGFGVVLLGDLVEQGMNPVISLVLESRGCWAVTVASPCTRAAKSAVGGRRRLWRLGRSCPLGR